MPRKQRVHYYSAFYHVMIRGNYKQDIFFDDSDRMHFYALLERLTQQFDCKVHLFCLMPNHVHFVIQVSHIPLSKIMQSLESAYSGYMNKKYGKSGHLFQGRYLPLLVQDENYFKELCFYIHMNPVRANITDNLDQYPWSSHHGYQHPSKKLSWVTTERILHLLAHEDRAQSYSIFMQTKADRGENPPDYLHFSSEGSMTIPNRINKNLNTRAEFSLRHVSLQKICELVCDTLGIEFSEMNSVYQQRRLVFARGMVGYFAHYHGGYTLKEIGFLLDRHPDVVSRALHNSIKQTNENAQQKKRFQLIRNAFLLLN